MIKIILFTATLIFCANPAYSQNTITENEKKSTNRKALKFQGDTRRTLINKKSVAIFGMRLGIPLTKKTEVGIGVYSSNLFGILGSNVNKLYQDSSIDPPSFFNAEIGFHYFSIFGEYSLIKNQNLTLSANSQIGLGWVDINFLDSNPNQQSKREGKSLVEHSIKVDFRTFKWLRLIGGIGYRYLITGEDQIKDTFNAPIFIVGFSIDFKQLFNK